MATTYLQAVNEILTGTNEVQLTSINFSSAVGIQAYVKNIVNRAYLELCGANKQWPFLSAASSDANDPFAGNLYVEVAAGVRWNLLKTGSTSVTTDYGSVDWDSFFLSTEGVTGASTPYEYGNLTFVSFDEWVDRYREEEARDAGGEQEYGIPQRVIVSKDGRFFGLSPLPNKAYRVYFTAWNRPSRLSLHSDEILIPDEFSHVLYHRARYYVHQFKENDAQAQMAAADYNKGEKRMVLDLTGTDNIRMTDDRIGW
jgi:hypothetical protein